MVIPNKNISVFHKEQDLSLREITLLSMNDDTDRIDSTDTYNLKENVVNKDFPLSLFSSEVLTPEQPC